MLLGKCCAFTTHLIYLVFALWIILFCCWCCFCFSGTPCKNSCTPDDNLFMAYANICPDPDRSHSMCNSKHHRVYCSKIFIFLFHKMNNSFLLMCSDFFRELFFLPVATHLTSRLWKEVVTQHLVLVCIFIDSRMV